MDTRTEGRVTRLAEDAVKSRMPVRGDAERLHASIASVWSTILGHTVSTKEVYMMFAAAKIIRESVATGLEKAKWDILDRDNVVDICGYALLLDEARIPGFSPKHELYDRHEGGEF